MGYMGFGLQRWITTMPTRKFFGKLNSKGSEHLENIAGHEIKELYHFKPKNLENLLQKKFTLSYRKKLKIDFENENRKQKSIGWIILIISLVTLVSLFLYFSRKLNLF